MTAVVFTDPVDIVEARKNTDWEAVLVALKRNLGKWALVSLEDTVHNYDSYAAILQKASWLRTKRFRNVSGFESKIGYTSFGARGVFARVR